MYWVGEREEVMPVVYMDDLEKGDEIRVRGFNRTEIFAIGTYMGIERDSTKLWKILLKKRSGEITKIPSISQIKGKRIGVRLQKVTS